MAKQSKVLNMETKDRSCSPKLCYLCPAIVSAFLLYQYTRKAVSSGFLKIQMYLHQTTWVVTLNNLGASHMDKHGRLSLKF
uniref:Uncharacterized protein n=1 Tax=Arundo donax TaxID=35708 RepID=A0A0A8YUZ8_ARUDO